MNLSEVLNAHSGSPCVSCTEIVNVFFEDLDFSTVVYSYETL
jgi:hypothetical protein